MLTFLHKYREKALALYVFTDDKNVSAKMQVDTSSGGFLANDVMMHAGRKLAIGPFYRYEDYGQKAPATFTNYICFSIDLLASLCSSCSHRFANIICSTCIIANRPLVFFKSSHICTFFAWAYVCFYSKHHMNSVFHSHTLFSILSWRHWFPFLRFQSIQHFPCDTETNH